MPAMRLLVDPAPQVGRPFGSLCDRLL